MRYNIPDDWDGLWSCYKVQWPNSTLWTALLHGALSDFKRGRVWDEKSGKITDAQAVGSEIWLRNTPLVFCGADQDCQGEKAETIFLSDGSSGEDSDMGQVVTEIRVVDGEFRVYYGHCCYDVVDLSAVKEGGTLDDLGEEPVNHDNDPLMEYSACGKAAAILEVMYSVANSCWDERDNPIYQWAGHVKGDHPGVELTTLDIVRAVFWAIDLVALESIVNNVGIELEPAAAIFDESTRQSVLCLLAQKLDSDATGITRDQYDEIREAFQSEFGYNILASEFWNSIRDAVGYGDLNNIAKLAASDTLTDCQCPEKPFAVFPGFGDGYGWSHVFDLRQALPDRITMGGEGPHWQQGEGVWGDPGVVDDATAIGVDIAFDTVNSTGTLQKIGVIIRTRGDEVWSADTSFNLGSPELMNETEIIAACGDSPSQAGMWQINKAVSQVLGSLENHIHFGIVAGHPPDENPPASIGISCVIVAIAIAGTGTDPIN